MSLFLANTLTVEARTRQAGLHLGCSLVRWCYRACCCVDAALSPLDFAASMKPRVCRVETDNSNHKHSHQNIEISYEAHTAVSQQLTDDVRYGEFGSRLAAAELTRLLAALLVNRLSTQFFCLDFS